MYNIALFFHILGVLCLMGGHALVHTALEVMRCAQTVESIRNWAAIAAGWISICLFLPWQLYYMAWTTWGWTTA